MFDNDLNVRYDLNVLNDLNVPSQINVCNSFGGRNRAVLEMYAKGETKTLMNDTLLIRSSSRRFQTGPVSLVTASPEKQRLSGADQLGTSSPRRVWPSRGLGRQYSRTFGQIQNSKRPRRS